MRKITIILSLAALCAISCAKKEVEKGVKPEASNVNFTPCKQDNLKADEISDKVNVDFTNKGVEITYKDFVVTCDFTTVKVTHTFVNGVLRITQKGTPNEAKCICHTDVSYTIDGISKNDVNVIFINGEQVYCHNGKEDVDDKSIEGFYTGTFTVKYRDIVSSGTTVLELKDGRFINTGNYNRVPAGGSGTYSINNDKIIFNDENIWTANFDWNLILNGEYDYTFDGNRLKFSANKNGVGYYEYDLKKEKQSICDPNVIIDEKEYFKVPEFLGNAISNMKIEGNILKFTITAGGCSGSSWIAKLVTTGAIEKSIPPQRTIELSFVNQEMCAAMPSREFSFNIECLQVAGFKSVLLKIAGKSILYEY